jgi:hypothetical protein
VWPLRARNPADSRVMVPRRAGARPGGATLRGAAARTAKEPDDVSACTCADQWVGMTPRHGLSAYAIKHGGMDYPHDPSDFCRCLHVSPFAPSHMRGRSPEWDALVAHWDELADMLGEEHPSGNAPRTYARMKELFRNAREQTWNR